MEWDSFPGKGDLVGLKSCADRGKLGWAGQQRAARWERLVANLAECGWGATATTILDTRDRHPKSAKGQKLNRHHCAVIWVDLSLRTDWERREGGNWEALVSRGSATTIREELDPLHWTLARRQKQRDS
jgi:hypothetical protein